MRRKRLIIAVGLPAILIGAIAFALLYFSEPVYQGKTLTAWLDQFGSTHWSNKHDLDHESEAAIRHFGTNQIPNYLKMLSARPSPAKMKLLARVPRTWAKNLHIPTTNGYELKVDAIRTRGAYGLIALGPDAKPAVPTLIALLTNKVDRVRYLSVFAIRCLGPVARDALPSVIRCVNDPDGTVQIDAVSALGTIHEDPEHVVPILIEVINKTSNLPHWLPTESAITALGNFKGQAAPAVPTLIALLDDSRSSVRQQAALALGNIHARPDLTVPALTAHFARARETSMNDLMAVFWSVAQFGADARSAVPAILEYARDNDRDLRAGAIDALKQIDPAAAAKVETK